MTAELSGKTIIVTGAAGGIGLGISRRAAAAGAQVIGFDINPEGHGILAEFGVEFRRVDVADVAGFRDAINSVRSDHGALHGIVNNAGITIEVPFFEMDLDQMERLWTINQRSVLVGCQAAGKIMADDGTKGAIVNIASNHARCSNPGYEAYAGTKGAITAMTRAMAWSLGREGIRVNALCPGLTMTDVVKKAAQDPEVAQNFANWHATKDVNSIDDVGDIAVFLLSDAANAMTGAEIIADRGMSALLGINNPKNRA